MLCGRIYSSLAPRHYFVSFSLALHLRRFYFFLSNGFSYDSCGHFVQSVFRGLLRVYHQGQATLRGQQRHLSYLRFSLPLMSVCFSKIRRRGCVRGDVFHLSIFLQCVCLHPWTRSGGQNQQVMENTRNRSKFELNEEPTSIRQAGHTLQITNYSGVGDWSNYSKATHILWICIPGALDWACKLSATSRFFARGEFSGSVITRSSGS